MKLSIVIVNWNTRAFVLACLDSLVEELARFGPGQAEVIVVDNASSDGSAEAIARRFPDVHLICNEGNVGFAAANNQGIRASTGQYVLLLNPDTEIRRGALMALVYFMDARPEAGAVGPRLLNEDGTLQISCQPRPTLFREWWRLFHADNVWPLSSYPPARWESGEVVEVDVIKGACLLLRRAALDEAGSLNEQYFMYTEEVDLCHRVQAAGWRLFWVPTAEVVHYGGQSTRQVAREMFLELYRSKLLYFRIHKGRAGAVLYKAVLAAAALARLALSPLALLQRGEQRQQHLQLASSYLSLLRALPTM